MKMLMLGHGGANQKDRILEFENLGHSLFVDPIYPPDRSRLDQYARRWAARMHSGPWVPRVNKDLLERSRGWPRVDLVWVEKAQYIKASTVQQLRSLIDCPIIHYTPDVAIEIEGTQNSPIFHDAISSYDIVVTTKDFEVDGYRARGARDIVLMEQAVSISRLYPRRDVTPAHRSRIGFIGHCEKHYRELLSNLADTGLPLDVRGPGWQRLDRRLRPSNRRFVKGGNVGREDYPRRVSGMDIGLGLLTKLGAEVITRRSMEIPACGTFLLAERTEKHQSVFKEGNEAEFFGSLEELEEKARFYLKNDSARERIAEAGYRRFMDSPHRLDRQLEIVLGKVTKALKTGSR